MPTSRKQIIAVDVDDVLVPHFQDLVDWYNAKYDALVTLSDNRPVLTPAWKAASIEEAVSRVHAFYETEIFRNAQPFHDAIAVLQTLQTRYDLIVITARDSIIEQVTCDWLQHHFTDLFREVHFTEQLNLYGKARKKVDVCLSRGVSYLIDDDARHIIPAHDAGIVGILFAEYPWNMGVDLPNDVVRCKDWAAVEAYFARQD